MHNDILIIAPECVKPNRDTAIDEINEYLWANGHVPLIKLPKKIFDREKAFTMDMWGGSYKTVFGDDFIKFLNSLEWYLPDQTCVIFSQSSTEKEDEIGTWRPNDKETV